MEVLAEILDETDAAGLSHFFLDALEPTEAGSRPAPGFLDIQTPVAQELHLTVEMEPQLLVHLHVQPRAAEKGTESFTRRVEPSHAVSPVESSTQFTAATERPHWERSFARARAPAGVLM